jgi:nucleoside-diphosphate-sugar epimerase
LRTLVFGGTQFIGLRLVHELLSRGHRVSVLNRGRTAVELPAEVERLRADRTDPASVRSALAGRDFDAVFDISAYALEALVPAVEALEGSVGRYVFCSSAAVYAPSDTYPVLETHPLAGGSSHAAQYTVDKVACEEYLNERWRASSFPVAILRPPFVYGPHNLFPITPFLSGSAWDFSFFARLRRGRPILVPGDGSRITHFVFVYDLAQAFAAIPESGGALGQAYNVAGPDAITLIGYVNLLGRVAGLEPEVVFVPLDIASDPGTPTSFPYVWLRNLVFGIGKAAADLGFRPRPMSAGLAEAYQWYLAERLDDRDWDFSAEDRLLERLRG